MASDEKPRDSHPEVLIGDRSVSSANPPYVIAELSANHGGRLETAIETIAAAASAGVDAIKLQTYTADSMTLDLDRDGYVVGPGSPWAGRRLYELYQEACTPYEWHAELFAAAAAHGLQCFSTPFDRAAVDFLEQFDPPAHKIASFELLDVALIRHAASTGRPLLISTGMASEQEIEDALEAAATGGAGGVVLLRCNSAYPAAPTEMDLATIPAMAARWGVPVGLSDHTIGSTAAVTATALGAVAIEKHVILARADGGPDAGFSAEPAELVELVSSVRLAHDAVGRVRYGPSSTEVPSLAFRRTLHVVRELPAGHTLTAADLRAIRPGGGLAPKHSDEVVGRKLARALAEGDPLRWQDLKA